MRTRKNPSVRKSEIVSAARQLFAQQGYEKTTVDAILEQLGVAKGCFYHHFSSKEQVFEACIESISDSLVERYLGILDDPQKPARQRLLEYLDDNFQLSADRTRLFDSIHARGFEEVHHRVVEQSVARVLPVFTRLVAEIRSEASGGQAPAGQEAEFTATALLGALQAIHEQYAYRPEADLDSLYEPTIDVVERIIGARLRREL